MKTVAIFSVLLNVFVLSNRSTSEEIGLIADPKFHRGFLVQAPSHPATVEGSLQPKTDVGPPIWTLAQWNSKSTIADISPRTLPSGACSYENADKKIIFNTRDAAADFDLTLTINGIHEYGGKFRTAKQGFPHLLVSQPISGPKGHLVSHSLSLAKIATLDFHLEARLEYDHRTTTLGYEAEKHASQFNLFYTLINLNAASSGYGDYLWFGTSLYDNRVEVTNKYVQEDVYTHKLIYSIGISPFTRAKIAEGNWVTLEGNLLPFMKEALAEAWKRGYLPDSQNLSDYFIGSMNMGWEMPGLNDASMQVRNYRVVATTVSGKTE